MKNDLDYVFNFLITKTPNNCLIINGLTKCVTTESLNSFLKQYGCVKSFVKFTYFVIVDYVDILQAIELLKLSKKEAVSIENNAVELFYCKRSSEYFKNYEFSPNKIIVRLSQIAHHITVDLVRSSFEAFGEITKIFVGSVVNKKIELNVYIEYSSNYDAYFACEAFDEKYMHNDCCFMSVKLSNMPNFYINQENGLYTWCKVVPDCPYKMLNSDDSSTDSDSSNDLIPLSEAYLSSKRVINCSNLSLKVTVEHLYNMFSIYGIVMKILFKSQSEADIEMYCRNSAEYCIKYFNNLNLFNQRMTLIFSNISEIEPPENPNKEITVSTTVKKLIYLDCNKHNHYYKLTDISLAYPKYCQNSPKSTLHFFNVPSCYNNLYSLRKIFTDHQANQPEKIVVFNRNNENDCDVLKGLLHFHSLNDAIETIATLNNITLENTKSNKPSYLKLVFSLRGFVENEEAAQFKLKRQRFNQFMEYNSSDDEREVLVDRTNDKDTANYQTDAALTPPHKRKTLNNIFEFSDTDNDDDSCKENFLF